MPPRPHDILRFWFRLIPPRAWFRVSPRLDARLRLRFGRLHDHAAKGRMAAWGRTQHGCLALILLLDQFSRQIGRGDKRAFACDGAAVVLTLRAVRCGWHKTMPQVWVNFLLMPLMHSESAALHARAVPLFVRFASLGTLRFERMHKAIIDRFGRYPHRNKVLGRASTAEEERFLKKRGSSF